MKIQSTTVLESNEEVLVEMVVSEEVAEGSVCESLRINARVQVCKGAYLPALQIGAIKRARDIFDEIELSLNKKY